MIQHLTYQHTIDEKDDHFIQQFFELEEILVFDIETTGLSPSKHQVILIGCIAFENKEMHIHQFFAEHINDEKDVLEAFIDLAMQKQVFINFNGSSFDIPYLNKRFEYHQLDFRIHPGQSFDLYRICKSSKLDVPNYKLKTLEKYLDIQREDTISGRESIQLYFDFMNTGDLYAKELVLRHNYEDILHLVPFMHILTHINLKMIAQHLPYAINLNQMSFYLTSCKIRNHFLNLRFSVRNPALYKGKDLSFYTAYTLKLSKGELSIQLPVFTIHPPDSNAYTFVDSEKLEWIHDFNALTYEQKIVYLIQENDAFCYDRILALVKHLIKHLND